jgi:hypothetical protein
MKRTLQTLLVSGSLGLAAFAFAPLALAQPAGNDTGGINGSAGPGPGVGTGATKMTEEQYKKKTEQETNLQGQPPSSDTQGMSNEQQMPDENQMGTTGPTGPGGATGASGPKGKK